MVKITADSTCDLPRALLEAYDITLTPLGVTRGGGLYRDGLDITTAEIAAHVAAGGEITTTSAVSIGDYEDLFRAMRAHYDGVIHLNIGSGFSCCHQNAALAAQEVEGVSVVDTGNLSVGQGLAVLAAAEAARAGKSRQEILDLLEHLLPRVEASFVLDTLDYMKKGGRCSSVLALGANLLRLHPCIEVQGNKLVVTKKYRGSTEKAIADYIRDRVSGREDLDQSRAILVHTCQDRRLVEMARQELESLGVFRAILEADAGCTIFSHCGPNTLGVMFLRKEA